VRAIAYPADVFIPGVENIKTNRWSSGRCTTASVRGAERIAAKMAPPASAPVNGYTSAPVAGAVMNDFNSPRPGVVPPRDPLPRPGLAQPSADIGNFANFKKFYRKFVPILVVFLVGQGARLADAADIAQEAMTKAYRWWPEIDHPTAWTRTAASRKLARHITRIDEDPVEQLPERNSLLPAFIDVEAWEGRHEILGALNRLSPQQRHVMAWTLDDHALAEIASELQICFQTVRTNLIQAHNTLAAYLGTTGNEQTSDVGSQQDQGLDLWLSYQHHKLVIDVIGTLEVEAGLREVLTPTHHADLARCRYVEADGPRPYPSSLASHPPPSRSHRTGSRQTPSLSPRRTPAR
jgi:DNA-directed RNA polymerase specialized sigma24 family protein